MYSFKLEIFEWTWHLQMVKTYVVQLTFGKNNIHKSRQQKFQKIWGPFIDFTQDFDVSDVLKFFFEVVTAGRA